MTVITHRRALADGVQPYVLRAVATWNELFFPRTRRRKAQADYLRDLAHRMENNQQTAQAA